MVHLILDVALQTTGTWAVEAIAVDEARIGPRPYFDGRAGEVQMPAVAQRASSKSERSCFTSEPDHVVGSCGS